MNIQEYIESGILEAYVLGSASDAETRELLYMKDQFPQVRNALEELELDMEHIAQQMAITPPPATWAKIEQEINALIEVPDLKPAPQREYTGNNRHTQTEDRERYIEVESSSEHMRIHKQWKWVFAAVFVLGKIFLACAIYFYLENRQAQQQIQELKQELGHYRGTP